MRTPELRWLLAKNCFSLNSRWIVIRLNHLVILSDTFFENTSEKFLNSFGTISLNIFEPSFVDIFWAIIRLCMKPAANFINIFGSIGTHYSTTLRYCLSYFPERAKPGGIALSDCCLCLHPHTPQAPGFCPKLWCQISFSLRMPSLFPLVMSGHFALFLGMWCETFVYTRFQIMSFWLFLGSNWYLDCGISAGQFPPLRPCSRTKNNLD